MAFCSAALSGIIVFIILSAIDLAKVYGLDEKIPPTIFSFAGAGVIYSAIYFVFNNYIWRLPAISTWMKIPCVAGEWECRGKTAEERGGHDWVGIVTITQRWDRIFIRLRTDRSRSDSVSAALICEPGGTYRVLYHYKNDPRKFEVGLSTHHGFSDMAFEQGGAKAEGIYFNGWGRQTFGVMNWTRGV
jgi:hypothetical protein